MQYLKLVTDQEKEKTLRKQQDESLKLTREEIADRVRQLRKERKQPRRYLTASQTKFRRLSILSA